MSNEDSISRVMEAMGRRIATLETRNAALRAMLARCQEYAIDYGGIAGDYLAEDIAALLREGGEHTKDTTPSVEEGRDG